MRPFPDNYELVSFFECEPTILDSEIPWAYNELTFETKSENGILIVKMISGYEIMEINWIQDKTKVLHLDLKGVMSLRVEDENHCDTLIAGFRSNDVDDLVIMVRPVISIKWGYNDQT